MGPWLVDVVERSELEPWLAKGEAADSPTVMVVRGDSPAVRELLPNVLDAAKLDPGRIVVWVKDERLLDEHELASLFGGDDQVVAVVLDASRTPRSWVYREQGRVEDAAFAFDQATV